MTDLPLHPTTYTAPSLNSVVVPVSSVDRPVAVSTTAGSPADEEEDYTIKCFCSFQVDDGNTVFCDRCETWQHIECYYFQDFRDGHPPDINKIEHKCIDCDPRPYDKRGASERQKERFYPEERKVKKPPTKAPKRRPKLSESHAGLTNGYTHDGNDSLHHDRTVGSPREHGPPLKRPKTSHRSSHSINFFSPPSHAEMHAARSTVSTSHTSRKSINAKHSLNGWPAPPYSPEFLHLYDNDRGEAPIQANVFHDITITQSLSSWSHDVESLSEAANGLSPQDIFHRCDESLDLMNLPLLHKEQRTGELSEGGGRPPRWTYLTVDTDTPRDAIIGELRGKIGHMQDYVQDPANRWDYLRHPAPFVFFHPKLPIYIDTRQEGSICRYLRRSCRPNLEMRTILENGTDYRFCLIAKEDIAAGSEVTICWTLDEHIRTYLYLLNNPEIKQEGSLDVTAYISDWVEKVLANFGGCACENPDQCGLAKYDRRYGLLHSTNGKTSRGRNGYVKSMRTPDIGHNPNSRASSEGKRRHDDDGLDSRSTSGSNPRSRDMTPTKIGNGDLGTTLGLELSDREKRKIAALEKNFEQLEQEKHQPVQRKKKRNSGGSAINTPIAASSVRLSPKEAMQQFVDNTKQKQLGHGMNFASLPNTPGFSARPRYSDASSSGKRSGSPVKRSKADIGGLTKGPQPNTSRMNSPTIRRDYVSVSVQTDTNDLADDATLWSHQTQKRKPYISLGKRLLMRCEQDRQRMDEKRRSSFKGASEPLENDLVADTAGLGASEHKAPEAITNNTPTPPSVDTEMREGPFAEGLTNGELPFSHTSVKHRPPDRAEGSPSPMQSPTIKPPPPPAVLHAAATALDRDNPVNGFRSTNLRVQLPSIPQLPHDPASAPSMTTDTTPTVGRSPFSHTPSSYPPLFSSSIPGAVAPSPIKKVSLSEYFSRQKNSSHSTDKGVVSSPTTHQSVFKTAAHVEEEAKGDGVEGTMIVDTPKEDDINPIADRNGSI